jgi:hypothetical protein
LTLVYLQTEVDLHPATPITLAHLLRHERIRRREVGIYHLLSNVDKIIMLRSITWNSGRLVKEEAHIWVQTA